MGYVGLWVAYMGSLLYMFRCVYLQFGTAFGGDLDDGCLIMEDVVNSYVWTMIMNATAIDKTLCC